MRIYLLLFFIIGSGIFYAQKNVRRYPVKETSVRSRSGGDFIDVNSMGYTESTYSIDQLVKDVLISSGTNSCVTPSVSNVTISPNQGPSDGNRAWGYFNRGTTAFPFKDGIVLSTGYARRAGNALEQYALSDDILTGSDPDLAAVIGSTGYLTNAAVLEFDFVPTSSQIKFNYLVASEEYYIDFPCSFADAFAILLKPLSGGAYENMAVLPGGAGPVSITNIHPANSHDGSPLPCPAINEMYFDNYNTNPATVTNFNGRTVPLTATATVVAGQAYHFKMVVADYGQYLVDTGYDTAVFIEGGSFNIGVELLDPSGIPLPSQINVCDNEPQVIEASIADPNLIYKWFRNGVEIPGGNTNTITATQPGSYMIEVSVPGNPCLGSATIEIIGGKTPEAHNATLMLCATPDIKTFDLTTAMPLISTTPGAVFKLYTNIADAQAQKDNYIQNVLNYNGNDGQILYVVVSDGIFCSKIVELTLKKEETPVADLIATKLKICPGDTVELTASGGSTYFWENFPGTGNMQPVTLFNTSTFTVYAIGEKGCRSLKPAVITIEVVPEIEGPISAVEICMGDQVTLDAGAGPNYTYRWSTGETTQTIHVKDWGIYQVEVDNGYCTRVFEVKVMGAALPFVSSLDYGNNTLKITAENPPINNNKGILEYSINGGTTWQKSNVFSGLANNTTYPILVRVVGTSCSGGLEFFTLKIASVITPNNDGINDVLDLTSLGDFENFKGSIFNRYGSEIFRFTKEKPIWDGTLEGKRLSTGTYWYQFNFDYLKSKTKMNWSGWIMLKNR